MNETATVSVRLLLGQETQQVQVRADAELIQTTVSSLGKAVLAHELLSFQWTVVTSLSSDCSNQELFP